MTRRLIIFLVRKKLGLKKYQTFQFANQLNKDCYYYFTETHIMKSSPSLTHHRSSSVSLNWLLDNECEIVK